MLCYIDNFKGIGNVFSFCIIYYKLLSEFVYVNVFMYVIIIIIDIFLNFY